MGGRKIEQRRIPLSVVLITVGLILLLTAGALYGLFVLERGPAAPTTLAQSERAARSRPLRTPRPLPTLMSWPDSGSDLEPVPFLLPSSPPVGEIPSEARADEAPQGIGEAAPQQPVRLVIPKLGIDAPVWEVGTAVIEVEGRRYEQAVVPNGYAAGWHRSTDLLGADGNTVFNGHHNVYGEIFRDLVELKIGDRVVVYDGLGRRYNYRVRRRLLLEERDQTAAVRRDNARWLTSTLDERITLISCWPYDDNTHRVIVVATPGE
ncbi:MAG: sortase [Candidatus Promineifilaceae bacterium]|nr:sortase [Candidatus Promineifilaceae bacterium]